MFSFSQFINESQLSEALITFDGKAYPKFNNVVILAGGAGCFESSTLVKTTNGYKPINEVQPGDYVYTMNEDTKEIETKEVEKTLEYDIDDLGEDLLEIEFENGEKVICTETHEFYVDGNWVEARNL